MNWKTKGDVEEWTDKLYGLSWLYILYIYARKANCLSSILYIPEEREREMDDGLSLQRFMEERQTGGFVFIWNRVVFVQMILA